MTIAEFQEEIESWIKDADKQYQRELLRGPAGRDSSCLWYGRLDTLKDIRRLATYLSDG